MIVFSLAVAFVLYVVAGYPALLGALSRIFGQPICKAGHLRTVSVIVPARNGARFITAKLNSIFRVDYPRNLMEVFVVSDGSDDGTDELVRKFDSEGVNLIRIPWSGKAAALNAAIPRCSGEIVVLTDVRQELEPASIRQLVACYHDPKVGVVSGEMLIRRGESLDQQNVGLYWRYESWIRDQLGKLDSMFGATGPFYSIRRSLAVRIPPDILLDDVYLPMTVFFRGYRLVVEKSARAFDFPTDLRNEFRRKVRTLAGNYQLIAVMPALLGPSNRMWFHFVSYKVGRLLLPYALIVMAASSFWLPGNYAKVAIAAQALFYLLAATDSKIPEQNLIKRVSSPAATFLVMMAAILCAISVFFVNPRSLWKETQVAVPEAPNL